MSVILFEQLESRKLTSSEDYTRCVRKITSDDESSRHSCLMEYASIAYADDQRLAEDVRYHLRGVLGEEPGDVPG
jgi:hypothetical protein